MQWKEFQSTRPRGARRQSKNRPDGIRCFNPRARVGRDATYVGLDVPAESFNPRARVGRDALP